MWVYVSAGTASWVSFYDCLISKHQILVRTVYIDCVSQTYFMTKYSEITYMSVVTVTYFFRIKPMYCILLKNINFNVTDIYEVLSESSLTSSKKKCWLILLNFGCHLFQISLLGNVCVYIYILNWLNMITWVVTSVPPCSFRFRPRSGHVRLVSGQVFWAL